MTLTTANGRLGNQIIRNLAVSLLAKKHNLRVNYVNNDLIKIITKYDIKIIGAPIIDLNNNDQKKQKKHISWEDNNINNNNINMNISELDTEMDSIFNKLKILPTKKYTEDNNVYRINNLEIKMDNLIDKIDKICSALKII